MQEIGPSKWGEFGTLREYLAELVAAGCIEAVSFDGYPDGKKFPDGFLRVLSWYVGYRDLPTEEEKKAQAYVTESKDDEGNFDPVLLFRKMEAEQRTD